jgi:hypothetical protein
MNKPPHVYRLSKQREPGNSQGRATAKKQNTMARSAWPLLFIPAVGYLRCCGEYGIEIYYLRAW